MPNKVYIIVIVKHDRVTEIITRNSEGDVIAYASELTKVPNVKIKSIFSFTENGSVSLLEIVFKDGRLSLELASTIKKLGI